MAYDTLKAEIRQYIKTNGANEITGQILQNVLLDMVNAYPSLDGYATQQWVQNQGYLTSAELNSYATQQWVTNQLGGYLPLTGGGTLTGSINVVDPNAQGMILRAHIDSLGIGIQKYENGEWVTQCSMAGPGYIDGKTYHGDQYIVNGGTSAQFLKADGSVDSTSYLPLTGGTITGNLGVNGYLTFGSNLLYSGNSDFYIGRNNSGAVNTGNARLRLGANLAMLYSGLSYNFFGLDSGGNFVCRLYDALIVIDKNQNDKIILLYSYDEYNGALRTDCDFISDGSVTGSSFIKTGGTSSQFLKADGSVDNNTYISSADLSGYATQAWVNTQLGGYLPLTGGNLNGNLSIYGTMNIYSSSIEWNDNGDYCRISFDDDGITVTAHGTGYVIANEFIKNGGTSSQFLKADGSVDNNTYLSSADLSGYATETWVGNNYLPLTGGTLTGELIINNNAQIYNSSSNPYLLFHKPNVNWTRLAMADDGTIEVRSGETGTAFRKFACGRINVDGGSDGYGYISIDSDGINIDGSNTDADQVYLNASLIYCSGDTQIYGDCEAYSFTQSSDIRRKNIVSDLTLSVEDIANAPLFKFTWKDGKDGNVHIGTSAQYWQGLMPELVSENKNGVLGMQYDVAAMAGVTTVAKVVVDHEDRISAIERKLNIN